MGGGAGAGIGMEHQVAWRGEHGAVTWRLRWTSSLELDLNLGRGGRGRTDDGEGMGADADDREGMGVAREGRRGEGDEEQGSPAQAMVALREVGRRLGKGGEDEPTRERKGMEEEKDGNLRNLTNFNGKNLTELTTVAKNVMFVKYNGIERGGGGRFVMTYQII